MNILSDHRGIFVDISTSQCFGSSLLPLQPVQIWDLITKRSHQITPYFEHKAQHLRDHHWFEKVSQLQRNMENDVPNHALAEDLYARLVPYAILVIIEKLCLYYINCVV